MQQSGSFDLDHAKNMFEYHSVFAGTLAVYLNLRKDLDREKDVQISKGKHDEAMSILRSNILYAVALKPHEMQNENIPSDEVKATKWIYDLELEYEKKGLRQNQVLDAMFLFMTKKQEIAGLTATSEKTMTSKMNMLISQVEREQNRGD